eukprot:m.76906 g.76906  ORF g.76906 m.76906 type:complete len:730 (-) comp10565_c0_seq1:226-2415(-)
MEVMEVEDAPPLESGSSSEEEESELVDVETFEAPNSLAAAAAPSDHDPDSELGTIEFTSVPVERVDEVDVKQQKLLMKAIRRERKAAEIELHKLHLHCLVAAAVWRSKVLSTETLHGLALSIVPSSWVGPEAVETPPVLPAVLAWFRASFALEARPTSPSDSGAPSPSIAQSREAMSERRRGKQRQMAPPSPIVVDSSDDESAMAIEGLGGRTSEAGEAGEAREADDRTVRLEAMFQTLTACPSHLVDCFIVLCRALGWRTRLVWVLRPAPDVGPSRKRRQRQKPGGATVGASSKKLRSDSQAKGKAKAKGKGLQLGKPLRKGESATPPAVGPGSSAAAARRCLDTASVAPEVDSWAEVCIGGEWVTVDCVGGVVGSPLELEAQAEAPFVYVLGVCHSSSHGDQPPSLHSLKDVTARYANDWLTTTERHRPDPEWWGLLLDAPGQGAAGRGGKTAEETAEEDTEDAAIARVHQGKGVPQTISGFKSHKLYVIERHLRGNQVLYPKREPVAMVKNEAVYLRSDVQTLRSREGWLKLARVVAEDATAVKLSKAGRKRAAPLSVPTDDSVSGIVDAAETPPDGTELFGEWQTSAYVPGEAKDGRVPRNRFGTVDLFQDSMLPRGCTILEDMAVEKASRDPGSKEPRMKLLRRPWACRLQSSWGWIVQRRLEGSSFAKPRPIPYTEESWCATSMSSSWRRRWPPTTLWLRRIGSPPGRRRSGSAGDASSRRRF